MTDVLQESVRTRFAAHQYPWEFGLIDELPLTATGRIRRIELREWEIARAQGGDESAASIETQNDPGTLARRPAGTVDPTQLC